jgi:4-hydroxybenzoate polyprenyltransferase
MDDLKENVPLVVDLDGTLTRTDLLVETLFLFLAARPLGIPRLLSWLALGRARFKERLAGATELDVAALPFDPDCLALIGEARRAGRRVILASAADQRLVDAVAAHLGLFDEAFGSSDGRNLKGARKARFLAERFGEGGFDYAGDGPADFPVWARARRVLTAGAGPGLRKAVDRRFAGARHLGAARNGVRARLGALARVLRPHQWAKNLLVFLPVIAAHRFGADAMLPALAAFAAFCLTASSAYVLNDLLDLPHDRAHPRKKVRPFAAGALSPRHGLALVPALVAAAALLSILALPLAFLAVLGTYYLTTLLYSLVLKRLLFIDVLTLAGLYTLRAAAGGAATGLALSPWLLIFCMFLFLALAVVKRQAELMVALAMNRDRQPGRTYTTEDLPIVGAMGIASGFISVLVFALYVNSPAVAELYGAPMLLWAVCPLLLLWIGRMLILAHRGDMHDDPLVFAFTDRFSWAVGALVVAVLAAGTAA